MIIHHPITHLQTILNTSNNRMETYHVRPDMERQQGILVTMKNQPHHKTSMTVSKLKNRSSTIGHLPYFLVGSSWIHCRGRYHIERFKVDLRFQGVHLWFRKHFYEHQHNHIVCFIIVMAFILSAAIIVFARLAPKAFIVTGVILNVVLGIGTAIFYFVEKYYSAWCVSYLCIVWCLVLLVVPPQNPIKCYHINHCY